LAQRIKKFDPSLENAKIEPKKTDKMSLQHHWLKHEVETQSFYPNMMIPVSLNPKLSFSKPTEAFKTLTDLDALLSIDMDSQLRMCEKDQKPILNPLNLGASSLGGVGAADAPPIFNYSNRSNLNQER
jgi:hypothetical protein